MITKTVVITNKLGLHARASSKLVAKAARFSSAITIAKGDAEVNAKSILGVMTLAASCGTEIKIVGNGDDEVEAVEAILKLMRDKFGEAE